MHPLEGFGYAKGALSGAHGLKVGNGRRRPGVAAGPGVVGPARTGPEEQHEPAENLDHGRAPGNGVVEAFQPFEELDIQMCHRPSVPMGRGAGRELPCRPLMGRSHRYSPMVTVAKTPLPSGAVPPAEVDLDDRMVRELLRSQHPDLADLPIQLAATGWDNYTFRLGDALAVRLPRIAAGVDLLRKEQHWLPLLAPGLPVAVPVPVRLGRPGAGYPWPWSIVPWVPGRSAEHEPLAPGEAGYFGRILAALHRPAPPEAPRNDYRGIALAQVDSTRSRLDRLAGTPAIPGVAWAVLRDLWHAAQAAPMDIPETLIHGDLHPKNLVLASGQLVSVLDWGDMTVGDPATDLAAAWMLLPVAAHSDLWAAYGPISDSTMLRARGWAVFFGVSLLESGLAGDAPFGEIGGLTLRRLCG